MAFGTWFKNLLVKGKNFIKKASPYIRKGIEIARKVGPMIGGTVGNVINGIANGADMFLDRIAPTKSSKPIKSIPLDYSGSNYSLALQESSQRKSNQFNYAPQNSYDKNIEMIQKPILGGNKGRLNPILK